MAQCRYCGHQREKVETVSDLAPCIADNISRYPSVCFDCFKTLVPRFTTRFKFCAGKAFYCSSNEVTEGTNFNLVSRRLQHIPAGCEQQFPEWARDTPVLCQECYGECLDKLPKPKSPPPPPGRARTREAMRRRGKESDTGTPAWNSDEETGDIEDCRSIEPRLNIIRQEGSHDCGLACCAAVLEKISDDSDPKQLMDTVISKYKEINSTWEGNSAAWTIELYAVLRNVVPPFFTVYMYTQQLGVDAAYEQAAFYEGSFSADEQRVNALFTQHKGSHVLKRSLSTHYIAEMLDKGDNFIVLVDSNKLACHCHYLTQDGKTLCHCDDTGPPNPSEPYAGHYIVLVGVDVAKRLLYYLNPTSICSVCRTSFRNFNEARRTFGTDEDLVHIHREY